MRVNLSSTSGQQGILLCHSQAFSQSTSRSLHVLQYVQYLSSFVKKLTLNSYQVKGPQYQGHLPLNLGMGPLFQGHLPPKLGVPTPNFRGRGPQYQGQFQSQYDPATKRTQFQTNQQKNSFTYNFYLMFQNFPALQTTRFQHFAKKGPPILGVPTPNIRGRPLILGVDP